MTAKYTERQGEIILDGVRYRLARGTRVRSTLAANFAPKQVIGPDDMNAHEGVSYLRWDDWTEGIGLEEFFQAAGEAPKRAWFSTCDLSNPGHLTLGPLVVQTGQPDEGATQVTDLGDLPLLAPFQNEMYGLFRTSVSTVAGVRVYKYDEVADDWGDVLHTSPNTTPDDLKRGDVEVGTIGGTEYIVFSHHTHYFYSSDGTSWTDSAKNAVRIAIFDNRLWGVGRNGAAWYATTPGTETDIASVPAVQTSSALMGASHVTNLFVARGLNQEEALFAATSTGLMRYDIENDRWIKLDITHPRGRFNGTGVAEWNGDLYLSVGTGVYRIVFGNETLVVPVGPDEDHGLPDDASGGIRRLFGGHFALLATIDTRMLDLENVWSPQHEGPVLSYNGKGWQILTHESSSDIHDNKHIITSSAYDTYRIWWSAYDTTGSGSTKVYYIDAPSGRINPSQAQARDYAAESTHITPWFKVGEDVVGIATELLVEVTGASDDETVKVQYLTNYGSGTWNDFTDGDGNDENTITSDGSTTFTFRATSSRFQHAPHGVVFRAIRFRLTLSRGATTTNTPNVRSLTLKFLKRLRPRWHHQVTLDISEEYGGFSPREQWNNLRASITVPSLSEFTFRDHDDLDADQRFFVQIEVPEAEEGSGLEYKGQATLILKEV